MGGLSEKEMTDTCLPAIPQGTGMDRDVLMDERNKAQGNPTRGWIALNGLAKNREKQTYRTQVLGVSYQRCGNVGSWLIVKGSMCD